MAAATVNQRMDAELAKKFQGQSRVDAEKTKAQLLTEARSRFANDPKTLASVENYLNQKTASIIQSAPAVAAPVAPAPTPIAPAPAAPAPGSNVSRAVR